MALVVEDGTGKTNADSYASVVAADAYHEAFGNTAWADSDDDAKEVALRKATRYLDGAYRFSGIKTSTDQALQWPRSGATVNGRTFADDDLPPALVNATMEAAFLALTEDLTPALARGGQVQSEQVDVIAVTYMDGAPAGTTFTLLDAMMRPLAMSSNAVRVTRA